MQSKRKAAVALGMFLAALGVVDLANGQVGGGKGGPGGGTFQRPRQDAVSLLKIEAVKKELELTDEQAAAIPDAVLKALSGVLNEKQFARLKEIEFQQRGNAALLDPKIQETLKITDSQRDNIKTILEDSAKEMREIGFQGGREKREALQKETQEKISGVLSLDQKNTWKKMTGAAFEMPTFGGFGGGAPGTPGADGKKRFEFKKKDTQ